jgi:hypothetical protein
VDQVSKHVPKNKKINTYDISSMLETSFGSVQNILYDTQREKQNVGVSFLQQDDAPSHSALSA